MTTTAIELITNEIERLEGRKMTLEQGRVSQEAHVEEYVKMQRQALQSIDDEIETIDISLKDLRAARKKLNGKR